MGTKHGYTEKRCSRCGKVKPRSEFRKRGSLMCTPCFNIQRKTSDEMYREKKRRDAAWRKQQRDRMREVRRKRKEGGK